MTDDVPSDGADVDPSDYDVTIERTFDAPRGRVWKAWTDPEQIVHWLSPEGFSVDFADGDIRPGGSWRTGMRSPDGTVLVIRGEYQEIAEPERLVFTHAWEDDDGQPGHETLVTVALEANGERTALTFRQEGLVSADSRDANEEGWSGVLDKLARHVESQQEAP